MSTPITVNVRLRAGAYVTSQVGGQRASSTMDAATAVERLGQKLLGTSFAGVHLVQDESECNSLWEILTRPSSITPNIQIGPTDI